MKVNVILDDGTKYYGSMPDSQIATGNRQSDLQTIANTIFFIEDEITNGKKIKEVIIPLRRDYSSTLNDVMERLIEFLFIKTVKVTFGKTQQRQLHIPVDIFSEGYTCLFSGGLDSYSGILNSKTHYGQVVGAFTRHPDQKLSTLISKIQKKVLSKYDIDVRMINSDKNKDYTRITRGILYILNALLLKNTNIIISEVGPTMHQPRFTLLDDVTYTTHPKVIEFSKKIAEQVLEKKIKIIKPNEDLTKSEVAANCPEKSHLKETCSCRTSMFCNSKKPNGDSCYGCVTRRLAMLVAGINDNSYRNDILVIRSDGRERGKTQYSNILHLLHFSLQCLNNFDELPWYTAEIIKKYHKEHLFERYALDNFAGLMALKDEGKIIDNIIQKKFDEASKTVSKDQLQNRVDEVRSLKFKPNFSLQ